MKIALIHDWLLVNAGSEKVIKELLLHFKLDEICLYTLFEKLPIIDKKDILGGTPVKTTLLQHLPYVEKVYRYLLPILPLFMQRINPKDAQLYFSSSHAVAKGFHQKKNILHLCYCHTPMRYLWYLNEDYIQDMGYLKKMIFHFMIPFLRKWDLQQAQKVHYFIANSTHIQEQIKKIYGRESSIIFPPVQLEKFALSLNKRKDFYLAVGRFVSYKKMDIVINAFAKMRDKKLVLIGNGYDAKRFKKIIDESPNIVWLGYQHDDELILYMQNAKACIFAAKEDFGIMCVEAQSTGTPVLALNYGGYKDTVIEGVTGYLFDQQTETDIVKVVEKFESCPLTNHQEIHERTARFSVSIFHEQIEKFTNTCIEQFNLNHA